MADVEHRAADHVRRHRLQTFGDHGLLAGGDIGLAPAAGAVLGLDPAEQQVLRTVGAEDEAFDARDLHENCPSSTASERSVEQRQTGIKASASTAYSITSSARCSNDCGTVMPSAFAVLRLISNSNVVGCWTGRSAALA